jgi:hypothetical protein
VGAFDNQLSPVIDLNKENIVVNEMVRILLVSIENERI